MNLQELIWIENVHLRLQTTNGIPALVEISPAQAACAPKPQTQPSHDPSFKPDPRFPLYSAAGLKVLRAYHAAGGPVCQVSFNGKIMMAKAKQDGLGYDRLRREMDMLVKLADAEADGIDIASPRLLGYIMHADTGLIIGFLREWVNASPRGRTMDHIQMKTVPYSVRERWAEQLEETLERMHEIGLVWGDCKPVNIIIDKDDDAWLIDLGGNCTLGWVDRNVMETVEGDAQGLSRICKHLGVDFDSEE